MKVSDLYPTKYLKGSDLAGHAVTVQIESILLESFYDQEAKESIQKPVLYFTGKEKGLVLNKSLAYSIAEILGSEDMDLWKGKKFVLFTEKRSVYGNIKDGIFSPISSAIIQFPGGARQRGEDTRITPGVDYAQGCDHSSRCKAGNILSRYLRFDRSALSFLQAHFYSIPHHRIGMGRNRNKYSPG